MSPKVSLALQGGGSHGAFSWGVLDRLLEEVEAGRFTIAAISGASAGALNATVIACALAEDGPALARRRLQEFWRGLSDAGERAGNALFGFAEPGPFGWNIDRSPGAIALEVLGLVVSPYSNPFYMDALAPLLDQYLPPQRLAWIDTAACPRLFVSAVNVATDQQRIFSQPEITQDVLRASSCLPEDFRAVTIDGAPYWDGGFIGNPPIDPLLGVADDLLLVMINPLIRTDMPPTSARAILDRLNEITFNASVVLQMNTIATINSILEELRGQGVEYKGKYRHINLHLIRDDAFMATLGFVSKTSTSWSLLCRLHEAGYAAADRFLREEGDSIGRRSSLDAKPELIHPVLRGAEFPATDQPAPAR